MVKKQETKADIIKETIPSEAFAEVVNISVGVILAVLILPFENFSQIILMVPALLSVRGNISGSFIARTARDLIIGSFKKNLLENVLVALTITAMMGFFIAALSMIFVTVLQGAFSIPVSFFFAIPLGTMGLTMACSMPISLALNFTTFKRGYNPCNVVPPVMASIDDFLIALFFFTTLTMLGVS